MKKRLFVSAYLFFVLASIGSKNFLIVSASSTEVIPNNNNYVYIGDYAITEAVNETVKIYIHKDVVDFVSSTGRYVYTEHTYFLGIITSTKYYYYANEFVDRIVSIRNVANDIDSIIFMVRELEKKAIEYSSSNYKDLVLEYIRTIHSDYATGYGGRWTLLAGKTPKSFISQVNSDYSNGLRFNEFFSSFVTYSKYNKEDHGDLDVIYQKTAANVISFVDPFDDITKIDLLHMFASMDGIYKNTGNFITLGNNNQRDILSWNGDLQQAARQLKIEENNGTLENLNTKNINYFFGNPRYGSEKNDILADIDAMNIVKSYVDMNDNSVSNSLAAYYALEDDVITRRFRMYTYTMIIDEEYPANNLTVLERFKREVYINFNLIENSDGSISNINYYGPLYQGHGIMRESNLVNSGTMPSLKVRKFVAKSFVDYIEKNLTLSMC